MSRIFLSVITTIVMFMLTINVIPPSKVVDYNPFLKQGSVLPMVAAHRGGATTNPQNTMKAFKSAVNEYHVDIIESDLLAADGLIICESGVEVVINTPNQLELYKEKEYGT